MAKDMGEQFVATVKRNLDDRRPVVVALCRHYAGLALQEFRVRQAQNEFWINRTFTAFGSVFSGLVDGPGNDVGWFLAHGVEYGLYLERWSWTDELKRIYIGEEGERISSALRVIVNGLQPKFFSDLQKIYAG